MTRVDVIVLNYNGKQLLHSCLTALRSQSYQDFQVLLVDNASSDGSVAFVQNNFPEIHILTLQENAGFSGGNNRGIERTSGEFVALLNNDTEVSRHWLEELVDALDETPEAGMAASKMVFANKPSIVDTAGDNFYWTGIGAKRGYLQKDGHRYSVPMFVFGACAGAALYRRKMLEDIGLLDERFFLNDEDLDLSFRAQLAGYRCVFVPAALVWHEVSATKQLVSDNYIYLSKRNSTWVILKNMPSSLLILFSGMIVSYALLSDLRWIIKGYGRQIIKARVDAFRALPEILEERRQIQEQRRISVIQLLAVLTPGIPRFSWLPHPFK